MFATWYSDSLKEQDLILSLEKDILIEMKFWVFAESLSKICAQMNDPDRVILYLLQGQINTACVERIIRVLQFLIGTHQETVNSLKQAINQCDNFITHYTLGRQDIGNCIVYVKGAKEGMGFVAKFYQERKHQWDYYVLTCAHLIGNPSELRVIDPAKNTNIEWDDLHTDERLDVAVLHLPSPADYSIPLPQSARLSEQHLRSGQPNIIMFYLEKKEELEGQSPSQTDLSQKRLCSRTGTVKSESSDELRVDIGHPLLGESGAPVFFPVRAAFRLLSSEPERFSILGLFCAREMERVGSGAQTVGAAIVKLSSILNLLKTHRRQRRGRRPLR